MDTRTERIRTLNDELRHHLTGGLAMITPGIAAWPKSCRARSQDNRCLR